jgi:RNA polymerase sigma factor for flagellar operon FliA
MTLTLDCAAAPAPDAAPRPTTSAREVDELVRTHMPLVGHLVREVVSRVPAHVSRDDLVSAGMYALTVSAQSFDSTLGVPFARFASIRVRGALTDELRTMDWASRGVRGKARELNSLRGELTHTLGREPSRNEIAVAVGMSLGELAKLENDVQRAGVMSLQALPADDGASNVPTRDKGPEELLVNREQIGYLRDAIAELPDKLRTVVEDYFFGQRRMVDIAAELGVTESRVSQLRSEALVLLRAALDAAEAADAAEAPTRARGRLAAKQAYCAAVASRSSLAGRLAATTVLGDARGTVSRLAELDIAN